jgi:hypothetical protein
MLDAKTRRNALILADSGEFSKSGPKNVAWNSCKWEKVPRLISASRLKTKGLLAQGARR